MTRFQTGLVLVLFVVSTTVFASAVLVPAVAGALAAVPALIGRVPEWTWWMLFGLAMSLRCRLRAMRAGACGRRDGDGGRRMAPSAV